MKLHPAIRFLAFALLLLVIPAALSSTLSAQLGIGISVRIGPPALPVYEQPICPGPAISGLPAIGPGATMTATTGCPAPGWSRL